jgi:hypothetical protein
VHVDRLLSCTEGSRRFPSNSDRNADEAYSWDLKSGTRVCMFVSGVGRCSLVMFPTGATIRSNRRQTCTFCMWKVLRCKQHCFTSVADGNIPVRRAFDAHLHRYHISNFNAIPVHIVRYHIRVLLQAVPKHLATTHEFQWLHTPSAGCRARLGLLRQWLMWTGISRTQEHDTRNSTNDAISHRIMYTAPL